MKPPLVFVVLVTLLSLQGFASRLDRQFEPTGLFLTFVDDPSVSIVIDWHTEESHRDRTNLYWRSLVDSEWQIQSASVIPFPFSDRMVNRVSLFGLTPDTEYKFHFGKDSRVFRFRTLPNNFDRPLRLIFGGDTRERQWMMEEMNRQALKLDPDLIIWGGDLAYADGREDRPHIWYQWFDANRNTLIHEDGRVVPVIVGVGNHEVKGGYWYRQVEKYATAGDLDAHREKYAPYFMNLFAFPGQPGFGVIDLGGLVSFIMLDSDHLNPVKGTQTYWLQAVLEARSEFPWIFPVYHVAAWPSVREFEGRTPRAIRENWIPLFEQHNVRVAFEHHDHTYKRTEPLRSGKIAEANHGIVYFGDGAWGVSARQIVHDAEATWYLARAKSVRHLIFMTIFDNTRADIAVIDVDGKEIDTWLFQ